EDEGVDRRAEPRRLLRVALVDWTGEFLLELRQRPEQTRAHELEDRPDLAEAVLYGSTGERQPVIGAELLRRLRRRADRILDVLRLVQDRVGELQLLQQIYVPAQERVARHDDVGVLELVGLVLAPGAVPESRRQAGGEALDLADPVRHDAGRRDDESANLLFVVLQAEQ